MMLNFDEQGLSSPGVLFPLFILFVLSTCFIGESLRTGALELDSPWFEYQLQLLSNLAQKLNISELPFPPL